MRLSDGVAMRAWCAALCMGLPAVTCCGETSISISTDPPLPARNLIANPGFEEPVGKGTPYYPWGMGGYYRGKGEAMVAEDEAHSGRRSFRFVSLSKGAAGQCSGPPIEVCTDIPYQIDFWVMCTRGATGSVQLRYSPEDPGLLPDSAVIPLQTFVKIEDRWISFASPPGDIKVRPLILLYRPRRKGMHRRYSTINDGVIVFQRKLFGGQKKLKVRPWLSGKGMGVTWFDDCAIRMLKTWLTYRVVGTGVGKIILSDGRGTIVDQRSFEGRFPGSYTRRLLVSADRTYTVEAVIEGSQTIMKRHPGEMVRSGAKRPDGEATADNRNTDVPVQ